jgi:hypothetical protein
VSERSYLGTIRAALRGRSVVLLDSDQEGRDERILLTMSPEVADRLGRALIAGAAQLNLTTEGGSCDPEAKETSTEPAERPEGMTV